MLRGAASGLAAGSFSGWLPRLAEAALQSGPPKRACILLWMSGGPSQIDTFDPKPGHANAGPLEAISTSVSGIQIGQHLPQVAQRMDDLCVIRSVNSREGDHGRATYYVHTGYAPQPGINYPSIGALVGHDAGQPTRSLPNFVSIAPFRAFNPGAFGAGYLGPAQAPLFVGEEAVGGTADIDERLKVANLDLPRHVSLAAFEQRRRMLEQFNSRFHQRRPSRLIASQKNAYSRATELINTDAEGAFNLDHEPEALREQYGRNVFGQSCLLARRLVERSVQFVEVALNSADGRNPFGWDTHGQNFDRIEELCGVLDPGWATLMEDLSERGMLDSTCVAWMGEFGRTPRINNGMGRDHFTDAWSMVLGGGGIQGGQVIGQTNAAGTRVTDGEVSVPDVLATLCTAVGVDPQKQNMSNVGRPIRVVDPEAVAIEQALA